MANRSEEVIIHKYFFGNQFGTFDEDRFKDDTDEATVSFFRIFSFKCFFGR